MAEVKRTAEEANGIGQETQDRVQRMGKEYQKAAESSFEAARRSFGESNQGFQALCRRDNRLFQKSL